MRRLEIAERLVAKRLRALLAEEAAPLKVRVELAIGKFEDGDQDRDHPPAGDAPGRAAAGPPAHRIGCYHAAA